MDIIIKVISLAILTGTLCGYIIARRSRRSNTLSPMLGVVAPKKED
jgi:hypothetical protein